MTEDTNTIITLTTTITEFISTNKYPIFIIITLTIFRKSLSQLLDRLTHLYIKRGDSELTINANPTDQNTATNLTPPTLDEKPTSQTEETDLKITNNEDDWFLKMHDAFDNNQIEAAEEIFRDYSLNEKDPIKRDENRAIYLFFRFDKAKDNYSIEALEQLANTAKNDESKFNILLWLSLCLTESYQYKKQIAIWENALNQIKPSITATKALSELALSLDKDNQTNRAKLLLTDALKENLFETQKAIIYNTLSKIEESLGNKSLAVYCKDKSLEYDPHNREELFNSAYSASNEGIDDISISNYSRLIRIDNSNSIALNNLGVRAQEADLKIKAVEHYKKSANLNNSLAMANQGYLLLNSGFIIEAEEIANKALLLDDPHKNIYSLLTAINQRKEEQRNAWNALVEKSLQRQKSTRTYIEQYYLGTPSDIEGNWLVNDSTSISISISLKDNKFEASWSEPHEFSANVNYISTLTGTVIGSSLTGLYSRSQNQGVTTSLLGLNTNKNVNYIGFLSEDKNSIFLISSTPKNIFTLTLSKKP